MVSGLEGCQTSFWMPSFRGRQNGGLVGGSCQIYAIHAIHSLFAGARWWLDHSKLASSSLFYTTASQAWHSSTSSCSFLSWKLPQLPDFSSGISPHLGSLQACSAWWCLLGCSAAASNAQVTLLTLYFLSAYFRSKFGPRENRGFCRCRLAVAIRFSGMGVLLVHWLDKSFAIMLNSLLAWGVYGLNSLFSFGLSGPLWRCFIRCSHIYPFGMPAAYLPGACLGPLSSPSSIFSAAASSLTNALESARAELDSEL